MFKRESEQPVKISFEEKKNNKEKRSLRERLSNIPVRRRVEAVLLAVVTVMASLSIDWSSLVARAAGQGTLQSGQRISTVFMPPSGQDTTTLSKAKISVKIPSADKEVNYTWKVYQNLKDDTEPESGVPVGDGGSGKIEYSSSAVGSFVEKEVTLPSVVLLGDETAAVVFTLTSEDGKDITYKIFDTSGLRYVKSDGDWIEYDSGNCIAYTSSSTGTPTDVTLSDKVPTKLALTAGQSYTFPEDEISWSPKYQRTLTLTEKEDTSNLIEEVKYPTFKVADSISNGGTAKVTVGGTGVTGVDVDVNVVSFELKGDGADKSVFTYTGAKYDAGDLYDAKCGSTSIVVASNFITTYKGTLINGTSVTEPLNAGSYTMTIKGKDGTDYAGLTYTKAFTIEQGTLTQDMFTGDKLASKSVATVKSGKIESITDGTFSTSPLRKLVYGVDFDAEVTKTTPGAAGVEYVITITGKNNFKIGDTAPTLNATEDSGVSLKSVVDHIGFATQTETYDADAKTPEIVFYDSSGEKITGVFTRGTNYTVKYNGTKRSTGTVVTDADEIIDAGEYTATIYGKETYAGSSMSTLSTEPYVLKPISFTTTNVTVTLKESSFEYSDSLVISPEVKDVTYKPTNRGLAAGTEYVMKSEEYSRQIGSHLVTIEGYGNYEGEATAEYTVFPSLLTSATFALDTVTDGTLKAEKTAEWDYVWTHNRAYTYRGSAIVPEFTANVNGETLSVGSGTNDMTKGTGINNSDVTSSGSKAYFILKLPTKYAGKKIKVEFEIGAKPLPPGALSFQNEITKDYAYGDHPITLDNGIDFYVKDGGTTLIEGTHYTISYENNENAGTATITATGIGNYTGTSSKTFTITPISVDSVAIKINPQKLNTSGTVVTDMNDVVITVIDGDGNELHPFTSDDFTLSGYKNNLNAWTSGDTESKQPQVTLTGKRNLTGTQVVKFEILKETLSGLKWKLNGTSINGILGSPGTTVDTGYVVSYAPNLPSKTISLYYSSGAKFESKNYTCKVNAVQAGTNTITIVGKGDYDGGEYKFTYEVRKLDISSADCVFTQTDGDENTLPTFKLTYGGVELTAGEDNDYTYVTNAEKDSNGKYVAKDGYTVTFTGKNSYTGTRTETFHIGKPFDSDHVFVTMYGPVGTKTVNGENRLTYFGNNDPYFILTSDDKNKDSVIAGPTYDNGTYVENTSAVYEISSISASDHNVGSEVTVTFKAKEEGGTWYNPIDSNGVSNGVTYTYKVVPGSAGADPNYGSLANGLSIYKYKKTDGGVPQIDGKEPFPTKGTTHSGVISFPYTNFKYKYTTVGTDPEIYISYDPSKVVDKDCATQSTSGGKPALPDSVSYADPVEAKFNDSSLFTVNRGLISANDDPKSITMYPVSGGWIASPNIQVNYSFENALLSDADFAFSPAEYTYTGAPANVSYSVKLGGSTLTKDTDFVEDGYYAYPDSGAVRTAIDEAIADKTKIAEKQSSFGTKITTVPTNSGTYVLVIKEKTGGHYTGYNIAKFSIVTATFTAALADPDNFSVKYGDNTKYAPAGGSKEDDPSDLLVTGEGGKTLYLKASTSEEDGYYIEVKNANPVPGINKGEITVCGTGNYKGCEKPVYYNVVADISKNAEKKFNTTNLGLSDEYTEEDNCLSLTLENDGEYPYVIVNNEKKDFNLSTLTLSYVENSKEVKLPSSYLRTTVTGVDSESSLTTVGKKKIVVEAASGAPVTDKRTYYVKVLGDISTASATFEAGGKSIAGTEIPYTDSNINVETVLTFRGKIIDDNNYTGSSESKTDVGKYPMTLTGKEDKYYTGQKKVEFSIVYDLGGNIKVYYQNVNTPLAGHSFPFTGQSYGDTIGNDIIVKIGDKTLEQGSNKDYTLLFSNDKNPGTNTASVTIKHASTSINEKTIKFSIGGVALTPENCAIELDNTYSYVYDGNAKTPTVSVSYKEENGSLRPLEEGTDFRVTYSNNINATNDAKAIIDGINGRYTTKNPLEKTFAITPKTLTDAKVDFPDVPFGGRKSPTELYPSTPTITVTSGGTTLREGTDYDISYGTGSDATTDPKAYFTKNPTETYTITITGKGNYTGTVVDNAKQLAGTLDSASIVVDQSMTSVYNGERVTFGETGPVIKNGNVVLVYGEDYTLDPIPKIINAGEYGITIRADKGDYKSENGSSSKTFTYTVTPRSVEENKSKFTVTLYDPETGSSDPASFTWTGSQITPKVRLEDTGISNHDASVGSVWTNNDALTVNPMMNSFAVSYGTNTDAGAEAGTVTLTASGNYTGTITKTFAIGQDISYASLTYDKTTAEYDGTPKSQTITVKYNGEPLTEGTAYESPIVYNWAGGTTSSPTKVGTYTPVIKGKPDGGYYGELKGSPFTITAKNKTGDIRITFNGPQGEVEAADYVCHYNASKQEPSINVYDISSGSRLTRYIDYDVTYGNNTNVGSAYVYVSLEGNFTGSATEIFFIEPYDISRMTLEFIEGEKGVIKNVAESKFPYSPLFKLVGKDDYGKPFEISYANSTFKQYLIVPDSSKVKKPGKGSFTVSGTGNLFGTTDEKEYEVYGRLSESNVSVKAPVYTGTKKDPEVTVTFAGEKLVLDTDYSLRIIPYDQTATGGGNVVVTGLGYFSGSVYTKYGEAGEVSTLELRGFSQQYVYSGRFAGPAESAVYAADSEGNQVIPADKLECTFTSSVDKAACVSANATVTITSKATLDDGTVVAGPSATYKIVQRNISSCDIKQLTSDIYTGKALTPPISVSYDRKTYSGTVATGSDVIALVSGRDYSLSYSNNVNPGTAVVTVTGKGNYTGTKRFMFTIKVADMATVTARQSSEGTIVSWTARPHVTGYRVLYNTNGMTKEETSRTTMTLRDAVPTVVGVQAYVKDSAGNITYGTPKYVAVTR